MIASAVDTRKTGFFALARRRNTELRLPAISRDGSSPSNGKVVQSRKHQHAGRRSSEWSMLPSRSALFSSPARNTMPSRPRLLPLFEEMKRQHAERRRGGDRRTRKTASLLQRGSGAGFLGFLGFLHKFTISFRELQARRPRALSSSIWRDSVAVLQELKNSATSKSASGAGRSGLISITKRGLASFEHALLRLLLKSPARSLRDRGQKQRRNASRIEAKKTLKGVCEGRKDHAPCRAGAAPQFGCQHFVPGEGLHIRRTGEPGLAATPRERLAAGSYAVISRGCLLRP